MNSEINYFEIASAIASVATAAAFFVGFYFFKKQLDHQKTLNSADILISLVDQYNSPEFRKNRREFASKLQQHVSGKRRLQTTDFSMAGTMFENISYLTNRHSIDIGMVENIFGFAIYNYYHILKNGNPEWDAIALEHNTLGETYREIEHFAESYESKRSEINKSKEPKDRQAELIQVHRAKMTDEYLALELGLPK